jgi:HEAT repeat protein
MPIGDQQNTILSKDYQIARKALDKAVLEKDLETIKLGLKNPILDIRKKTVEAMAKIGDETFVPNLIVALEQNQGIIAGGSEIQSLQNKLNEIIISTLEKLTKLKFNISEKLSSEDIDEVIRKSREWCSANKKNNENTEIKKP